MPIQAKSIGGQYLEHQYRGVSLMRGLRVNRNSPAEAGKFAIGRPKSSVSYGQFGGYAYELAAEFSVRHGVGQWPPAATPAVWKWRNVVIWRQFSRWGKLLDGWRFATNR